MKKIIYILVLFIMLQTSYAYSDVSNEHWANKYIMNLQDKNIISGYPDDTFKPENNIKKSEFITMLGKTFEEVDGKVINEGYWANQYVELGQKNGFLSRNYEIKELESDITRYEAMEMIINCYENTKNAYLQKNDMQNKFNDLEKSDYKIKNIAMILDYCDILKGYPDSTMRINNNITRAEASTIITNFINNKDRLKNFKISNLVKCYELDVRRINLEQLPFNLEEKQEGMKNETKVVTRINDIEIFKCEEDYAGKYKEIINEMYNSELPYFKYRKKIADGNFIVAVDFDTINENLEYTTSAGYFSLKIEFPGEEIEILDKFDFGEIESNKKGQGYNGVIVLPREEYKTTAFFVVNKMPEKKIEFTRNITTMYDAKNRVHVNINSIDKLLINMEEICEE